MKRFLVALFLSPLPLALHAEEPAPEASLFVTSCAQIVAAFLLMPDGTWKVFDNHSAISAEDLKRWAMRGKQEPKVKEVGCYHGDDGVPT